MDFPAEAQREHVPRVRRADRHRAEATPMLSGLQPCAREHHAMGSCPLRARSDRTGANINGHARTEVTAAQTISHPGKPDRTPRSHSQTVRRRFESCRGHRFLAAAEHLYRLLTGIWSCLARSVPDASALLARDCWVTHGKSNRASPRRPTHPARSQWVRDVQGRPPASKPGQDVTGSCSSPPGRRCDRSRRLSRLQKVFADVRARLVGVEGLVERSGRISVETLEDRAPAEC